MLVVCHANKVDLQYMVCRELKISTTGICSDSDSLGSSSLEKESVPVDVVSFYRRVGSFASVSMSAPKLWTKDLGKCPPGFSLSRLETWNPEAEGVRSLFHTSAIPDGYHWLFLGRFCSFHSA